MYDYTKINHKKMNLGRVAEGNTLFSSVAQTEHRENTKSSNDHFIFKIRLRET